MIIQNTEELCIWKKVANNDFEKLTTGVGSITLSPNKPCHDCDGTEKYAEEVNCRAYKL